MINYFDYNNNTYLIKLNCCITLILPEETTEFTTIEINEENVIDLYYKKNDIFIYNETQKKCLILNLIRILQLKIEEMKKIYYFTKFKNNFKISY